jgi:uncharacterized protein YaaQ
VKLIVAVVQTKDADACVQAWVSAGHVCTRIESFGGFLEQGNTTLFTAVDDAEVDSAIQLLGRRARQRNHSLHATAADGGNGASTSQMDVEVGGASVFVLDVTRMEKL